LRRGARAAPDGASGAAEHVNREITQPESSPRIAANAGAQAKADVRWRPVNGSGRPRPGVAPGRETPAEAGVIRLRSPTESAASLLDVDYTMLDTNVPAGAKKGLSGAGMYGVLPSDRMRRDHTCHSF